LKRVLITRPQPGASQTALRLTALGIFPVLSPVLSIVHKTLHVPPHIAATLLTSRNAVAACPPSLHNRPVFAVGSATAAQATEAGFTHVSNADGDAHALARLVADTLSPAGGSLFLPVAEGQGSELTTSLRKHGFRIVRRVAYRAEGVSSLSDAAVVALREGQLTHAMFFSGETSRHFVHLIRTAGLVEAVRDVEAVSISQGAAVALRPLPWRRISVAAKPNQDAMLVLLQ
jgi:uroporphyrinogen-III synthase